MPEGFCRSDHQQAAMGDLANRHFFFVFFLRQAKLRAVAIQLYLQEEDYLCLLEHAVAYSSMHSALAGALPSTNAAKSTWKVIYEASTLSGS